MCGFAGEYASGEFVGVSVCEAHCMIKIGCVDDGEDWSEDFLCVDGACFGDPCEDVGCDQVFDAGRDGVVFCAYEFMEPFCFGGFDESVDGVCSFLVDDWGDIGVWIVGCA